MVLMTDQPQSPLTPLSSPDEAKSVKTNGRKESRDIHFIFEAENGGEEKQRRNGRPGADLQLLLEAESDLSESRRKPTLMRSKTFDQSPLSQISNDCEVKIERKKSLTNQFSKTNAQYHKIFAEISKDELLRQSYTCALQKDILYQGKMYVSDNWICFHSKVFGKDTKIAIPVLSVTLIKKTKTAILVPNALVVATTTERHVFVSFLSRDTTYKVLRSVCFHLDGMSTGSSPVPSSAENSFRSERPPSLPLDFSGNFSDLDGTVRQRRQDMEESSSSGSQTPDYEKMAEFPVLPETFLSVPKQGEVPVHADVHPQQAPPLAPPPDATPGQQQNGAERSRLRSTSRNEQTLRFLPFSPTFVQSSRGRTQSEIAATGVLEYPSPRLLGLSLPAGVFLLLHGLQDSGPGAAALLPRLHGGVPAQRKCGTPPSTDGGERRNLRRVIYKPVKAGKDPEEPAEAPGGRCVTRNDLSALLLENPTQTWQPQPPLPHILAGQNLRPRAGQDRMKGTATMTLTTAQKKEKKKTALIVQ